MTENRLKMRIYGIFRSCKSKNDVVDTTNHHQYQLIENCPIFSPLNFTTYTYNFTQPDGRKCPPASPIISPLHLNNNNQRFLNSISSPSSNPRKIRYNTYSTRYNYMPTEIEEEKVYRNRTTSAALLSSDSDRYHDGGRRRRRGNRPAAVEEIDGSDMMSLAVVKRSRDPYGDFRASMVEMIVENQIFGAKDLGNLLRCFLSLNARHYHDVILQVFNDILKSSLNST